MQIIMNTIMKIIMAMMRMMGRAEMHEYIGGRGSGDAAHNEQSVTNHITWCYIFYHSLSINYLFLYHICYWPWERCNA